MAIVRRSACFCACRAGLEERWEVALSLICRGKKFAGMERGVRSNNSEMPHARYAFRFVRKDVHRIML